MNAKLTTLSIKTLLENWIDLVKISDSYINKNKEVHFYSRCRQHALDGYKETSATLETIIRDSEREEFEKIKIDFNAYLSETKVQLH